MERAFPQEALDTVLELCATRLPKTYGEKVAEGIQVLSCTRKGPLGTHNLNQALQQILNPPAPHKAQHPFRDVMFRQGDKVMQITNNYDLTWRSAQDESARPRTKACAAPGCSTGTSARSPISIPTARL